MRRFFVPAISPIVSLPNGVTAVLVFLCTLAVYLQSPIYYTLGDPIWNLPTAFSLINEGNTDLKEYEQLINQVREHQGYTLYYVDDTPYNFYPIGPSLVAVPFVVVFQQIAKILSVDLYTLSQQQFLIRLDLFIAGVIVAATAALVYLIARFSVTTPFALLVALIFAFGTSALSIVSRASWQHGPSMLALAFALYCLLRAERSAAFLFPAGVAVAFAFISRPTNGIAVVVFTFYSVFRFRWQSLRFLLGGAVIALPFVYANLMTYGNLLPPYDRGQFPFGANAGALIEGLLGTLISPNRGLFIFSPILLLSIWGVGLKLRSHSLTGLDLCLVLIMVLHWLVVSVYSNWYAGHGFGPRYMSDILPFMVYFLLPIFPVLPTLTRGVKAFAIGLIALTTIISVAIHLRGASVSATHQWNGRPVNVDVARWRVWDWSDLQFLRGLGNGGPIPEAVSSAHLEFDSETRAFLGAGWGYPEHYEDGTTFQWTDGHQASLTLWLIPNHDLAIQIGILRAITPEILETFQVDVNGSVIELDANGQVYSGIIPAGALKANGGPNELRFTIPHPVSPRSLGDSMDERLLGLMVDYLDIRPVGESSE